LTAVSPSAAGARRQFGRVRPATLRNATLWLFIVCGATAIIEPSPYEFMFFVVLAAYARGGLTFERTMAPLVLWLALWNAGGLLGLVPFTDDQRAVMFVGVSIYMAMTSIVISALIAHDPLPRIRIIRSGDALAGVIAAILSMSPASVRCSRSTTTGAPQVPSRTRMFSARSLSSRSSGSFRTCS
jgi:hypothetical protein